MGVPLGDNYLGWQIQIKGCITTEYYNILLNCLKYINKELLISLMYKTFDTE